MNGLKIPITIEEEGPGELEMYPVAREADGREILLENVATEYNEMAMRVVKLEAALVDNQRAQDWEYGALLAEKHIMELESNWIDIKIKPENDRLVFLLIQRRHGGCTVIRAEYIPPWTVLQDDFLDPDECDIEEMCDYSEKDKKYYVKEGWFEMNENEETHFLVSEEELAWKPLPSTEFEKENRDCECKSD